MPRRDPIYERPKVLEHRTRVQISADPTLPYRTMLFLRAA